MKSNIDFFKQFRLNLSVLLAASGSSPKELSIKLKLNIRRVGSVLQPTGQHKPTAQELYEISKFFKIPVEDLLHKTPKIIFE